MMKTSWSDIEAVCGELNDWKRDLYMKLWNHINHATEGMSIPPDSAWIDFYRPFMSFKNSSGKTAIYWMEHGGSTVSSSFSGNEVGFDVVTFKSLYGSTPDRFMKQFTDEFCWGYEKRKALVGVAGEENRLDILDKWNRIVDVLGFEPRMWDEINYDKGNVLWMKWALSVGINECKVPLVSIHNNNTVYVMTGNKSVSAGDGMVAGKTLSSKLFSIFGEKENGKQEQ